VEKPLILDRYRPLAELGEGGHGSVTLAFDTRMARRVAVKRLPLPPGARSAAARAALAEARTGAMLNHPNVVTVFEWDTDEDEAFLVMEHVEGVSLADVLEDGPLDADELAAVVAAVSSALTYAHANGVLHLDVKPENVLISREGDIKVADFGIAALTGAAGTAYASSGTVGYMAPEQLDGRAVDARTDEWAFAALTFESLTGANPFASRSREGARFKALVAEVPAPSAFRPQLGADVDEILLTALSPDTSDRFVDVVTFADDLLPLLGDPAEGFASLAQTARDLLGEDQAEGEPGETLGLWDRYGHLAGLGRRGLAAVLCGWAAWLGLAPLLALPTARVGGAALVALAAALVPAIGIALAIVALAAGLAASHAIVAAIVLVVLGTAHWVLVARHNHADGLAPLFAPVLAVARLALAVPLLLGFAFEPLPAALAAAFSSLAVSAVAAASGAGAPLLTVAPRMLVAPYAAPGWWRALLDPGVALAALAWGLAAAVCSLACRRATRLSSAGGGLVGLAILFGGYAGWGALRHVAGSDAALLQQLAASLILFGVVVAAGPPLRGEDE